MTTLRKTMVGALVAALATATAADAANRTMVVTIDDLPAAPPRVHDTAEQEEITTKLLATLKRFRVPAIGFVNENKLEVDGKVDPARVALLERWLDAGHELGNHGYAHLDLHRVPADEWEQDVLRGEKVLRPMLTARGLPLRFFRHPFLHTGRDRETRDHSVAFLNEHGYRVAPVTIDNQEWLFGGAYARATSAAERERIGKAYIEYMDAMVIYFEEQAEAIIGGPLPQVLLIHAYALNADYLDALLLRIQARGYRFIPLDEALKHQAFDTPESYFGPAGITWLHRWALTRDLPRTIFGEEPDIPAWLKPSS